MCYCDDDFSHQFQLETDESILIEKARGALEKYRHNAVIGNVLQTRKRHVVFVYPNARAPEPVVLAEADVARGAEIEQRIVQKLAEQHAQFVRAKLQPQPAAAHCAS